MKKYKYFSIIVITFLISMASFDYFFYDLKEFAYSLSRPTPLSMDKNNKVSVLFENKIFVDGVEIEAMPLATIVGDSDYHYGLMNKNGKNLVIAVKAYKSKDCSPDEIYAEFKLGEGGPNRKIIFHASAFAKIRNRSSQTLTMNSKDETLELTIKTTAYFGPPKQVARYRPTPFNSALANEKSEVSAYMIEYILINNNSEKTKSGAIVIKEDQVGKITTTTQLSPELSESLSYDMKISRDADGKHQLDLYSVHKLGVEEERMILSESVNVGESNYFFDGRLEIKLSQYKVN